MTHYLADWQSRVHHLDMTVMLWNKLIDGWDVEGMAKRLESVGAGHYQISIGQNSGYYLSPNPVYDRLVGISPSKCSRRDLVADLYGPLNQRGVKLMVYLPSGGPGQDRAARERLDWEDGAHRNREFQLKWQQVIAEWSGRWGSKVCGWWFDGCYFPNSMYRQPDAPNWTSFAAAARAGNPESALAFNPGVYYRLMTQSAEDDYIAGEIDKPDQVDLHRSYQGLIDGVQIHMLSFLGETWGQGEFELRAAVYAERTTVKLDRVGNRRAPKKGTVAQCRIVRAKQALRKQVRRKRRLVKSLEIKLKRATRLSKSATTPDNFKSQSKEWQSHLKWMNSSLTYFKPLPRPATAVAG